MSKADASARQNQRCIFFDTCRRDGHASAICMVSCEEKFKRCEHRPEVQEAMLMRLLNTEIDMMMRMTLDELIEVRLTRYVAEGESQELIAEIRMCLMKINELME